MFSEDSALKQDFSKISVHPGSKLNGKSIDRGNLGTVLQTTEGTRHVSKYKNMSKATMLQDNSNKS
jgi:hypothetical protein